FDRDCLPDQMCSSGTCTEVGHPVMGVVVPDAGASTGQPCQYTHECPVPDVCRGGVCTIEGVEAVDCGHGEVCVANRCVPPGGVSGPGPDASGGDGGSPGDGSAFDGTIPDGSPSGPGGYGAPCKANDDCANVLLCKAGFCVYQCSNNFDC